MLDSDQTEILLVLKDHFPKATDADGPLVWDAVKGYGLDDAIRAVKEHRIEQGKIVTRPDVRRVRTLAATYYRERHPTTGHQTIWQALHAADPFSFDGKNRIADLMLHFGNAWQTVKRDATDERGKSGARATIRYHAHMAFEQEGMTSHDAEVTARDVVELAPGEKVVLASVFKQQQQPETSAAKAKALRQLTAGAA